MRVSAGAVPIRLAADSATLSLPTFVTNHWQAAQPFTFRCRAISTHWLKCSLETLAGDALRIEPACCFFHCAISFGDETRAPVGGL